MVSRRVYPQNRYDGRFFGRRVNCELVPLLPAWAVACVLDDPRKIPYLLVWRNRSDCRVQEAVRVASYSEPPRPFPRDWTGWVEVRRTDGTRNLLRTVLLPLPRNGGSVRLLVCPFCQTARRGLYAWEPGGRFTNSAMRSDWGCRKCNELRYESEGGARVIRVRYGRLGEFGVRLRLHDATYGRLRSPRSESWYPYVFTSPKEAAKAGFCVLES